MSTAQFILQALFFVVNTVAVLVITIYVFRIVSRMEQKLDDTIGFMMRVKARHDITYMRMLCSLQDALVREERFEEAARVKAVIDREIEELNKELKTE